MASSAGIEPTTACLEGKSSIQLSYEDKSLPGFTEGTWLGLQHFFRRGLKKP